jgi:hypothetical protein
MGKEWTSEPGNSVKTILLVFSRDGTKFTARSGDGTSRNCLDDELGGFPNFSRVEFRVIL